MVILPAFLQHIRILTVDLDWSHLFEQHAPSIPSAVVAATFQVLKSVYRDVAIFCVTHARHWLLTKTMFYHGQSTAPRCDV